MVPGLRITAEPTISRHADLLERLSPAWEEPPQADIEPRDTVRCIRETPMFQFRADERECIDAL